MTRSAPAGRRRPAAWIWLIGPAVLALALIGCGPVSDALKELIEGREAPPEAASPAVPVRTASAVARTLERSVQAPADVLAENRVVLQPEASGTIQAVHAREGEKVERGQLLIELDQRQAASALAQAEAAVAAAEAGAAGAEQTHQAAQAHYERMTVLAENESISAGAFDEVKSRNEQARAAHLAAQAQLKAARAQLADARKMVDDTRLTAPFDGLVAERYQDPGAVVQTMPPTDLMLLVQIDPVRVKARLGELDLVKLRPGMPAQVELDAFPGESFTGTVRALAPVLDPATRTGAIEVALPNTEGRIRPGMAARVRISLGQIEQLVIPRTALVSGISDRQGQVFVVTEAGRAERRDIALAGFQDEFAVVASGLAEGEMVIARGTHAVSDGVEVRVEE